MKRLVPAEYFLIAFTVPAEFRALAFAHQETFYDLLLRCGWETLRTFSQNDKQLQGTPGTIAVLHTHTRKLDFHPHVHFVMPAAAVDAAKRQWRTKSRGNGKGKDKGRYLFNHKALAKVFRAKMLAGIEAASLALPARHPREWGVDCKAVGSGEKALIYLGHYLYRGVIRVAGTENSLRHAISVVGVAACAAEGISARPQFRLSAPHLQALDRLAARGVALRSRSGGWLVQGTVAHRLPLLRGGDEDRANANSIFAPRRKPGADCHFSH
jgi:hypothetical protein